METSKIYIFAKAMSELLFQMRIESDFFEPDGVSEEYANKVVDDPKHILLIKKKIHDSIVDALSQDPDLYKNGKGEYEYVPDTYDHSYIVDTYVEELYEAERQARLKVKFKVWVEIEKIETDPETEDEDYIDMECPVGITYCNTLEEAVELQKGIDKCLEPLINHIPAVTSRDIFRIFKKQITMENDLTYGLDIAGDHMFFIHQKHFLSEWEVDETVKRICKNAGGKLAFRIILSNGEQGNNGYLENGEIIQWG